MSDLDVVFKIPLPRGGLILPLSSPQVLSTEFRVHWRGGLARSARTGLRWSPGPMNSFFNSNILSYYSAPQLPECSRMSEHIYLTHLLGPRINDALHFHENLTGHCSGNNCSSLFTTLISCGFASPFVPIFLPVLQ